MQKEWDALRTTKLFHNLQNVQKSKDGHCFKLKDAKRVRGGHNFLRKITRIMLEINLNYELPQSVDVS